MANILFVHQNFPGQFPHIADALIARGDKVAAIGGHTAKGRPGVDLRRWSNPRSTTKGIFEIATRAEADMIRGTAAVVVAEQLKREGFHPDIIIAHPGWGESLFLREIWREAKIIVFGELLYSSNGGDLNFDPESGPPNLHSNIRAHAKNATQVLATAFADRIICPTPFQRASYPPALHSLIRVVHEGVDVENARRRPDAVVRLPDGSRLDGSTPVVTFVARTLEPLRGFRTFMRALPELLVACPTAQVLIIGDAALQGYGAASPNGKDWKSLMLDELGERLPLERVHFLGRVAHTTLIDAFSISWAHVYYTYPFVLSWSLVEAMAAECLVIGSDTAPVRDAIDSGVEGLLLPFFDIERLSHTLIEVIRSPSDYMQMRRSARIKATEVFDRKQGTSFWIATVDELLLGSAR